MHKLIRNEQCPECAKLGKDTSKDNLAIYTNGKWCFSCGYIETENKVSKFKRLLSQPKATTNKVSLPEDSVLEYPDKALKWVEQYELSSTDLLKHNVLWSEYNQRLIFPILNPNELLAWQGRYFGPDNKVKWFGIGNLQDTFHIIGKDTQLILCEDIISAIKLSKHTMSMPLFGCNIGSERFKRIYKLLGYQFDTKIWLDPDMRSKALKESRIGNTIGLSTSVIYSDKDPKEHTHEEINKILWKT